MKNIRKIVIGDDETTPVVEVMLIDGVPQSLSGVPKRGYWHYMMPEEKPQRVLLLGVGGGTIARELLEKWPDVEIVGVDISEEVIEWAKENFGLEELKMTLLIEDGFGYVDRVSQTPQLIKKYDLILVDMWDGCWFPFRCMTAEFIEKCKKVLKKSGRIHINAPNLDYLAGEGLTGMTTYRNELGPNIIYKASLTRG